MAEHERIDGMVDSQAAPVHSPDSQAAVKYLTSYVVGSPMSYHRIISADQDSVTMWYKDYRRDGKRERVRLEGVEFMRRYAMHILPPRFVRVRYAGLLAPCKKQEEWELCCRLLQAQQSSAFARAQTAEVENEEEEEQPIGARAPGPCPGCGELLLEWMGSIPGRRRRNAFDSTRMPPKTELARILLVQERRQRAPPAQLQLEWS